MRGRLPILACPLLICAAGALPSHSRAHGHAHGQQHHLYAEPLPDTCSPDSFIPGQWAGGAAARGTRQLYGTTYAQRRIWSSQHPEDCATARYLLTPQHISGGIGSVIHVAGHALSMAVSLNRVLLMEFGPDRPWHDPAWCGADQPFDGCYFVPLSSCRPPTTEGGAPSVTSWEQAVSLNDTRVLRVELFPYLDAAQHDPRLWQAFAQVLEASPIPPHKHFYWVRAQTASYILRPSARMLAEVAKLRESRFPQERIRPGTVSIHIRRGDKVAETNNTATAEYVERAEEALALRPHTLSRHIFLSTDDPRPVEELTEAGGLAARWQVSYVDVPRVDTVHGSILHKAREMGPGREMVESLLNLELALECDAWVSTLSSNWGRLIDELRSTIRCKADGLYLDAQQENPPQYFDW